MAHSAPWDCTVGFSDGTGVGLGVGSCVDAVAFVGFGVGAGVGRTIAAATVQVGNAERSRLSVDHLLLARGDWAAGEQGSSSTATPTRGGAGEWRILSVTSSPRTWPRVGGDFAPTAAEAARPSARKLRM